MHKTGMHILLLVGLELGSPSAGLEFLPLEHKKLKFQTLRDILVIRQAESASRGSQWKHQLFIGVFSPTPQQHSYIFDSSVAGRSSTGRETRSLKVRVRKKKSQIIIILKRRRGSVQKWRSWVDFWLSQYLSIPLSFFYTCLQRQADIII